MIITVNKALLKAQVKILKDYLKEGGFPITQSSSYVLLSKLYGFNGWNELSAFLKNEDIWNYHHSNKKFNSG
jgi:hypothetical protein